jgi:hypothetical protein
MAADLKNHRRSTPGVPLETLQSDKDVLFHPAPFGWIADCRMQHLAPSLK